MDLTETAEDSRLQALAELDILDTPAEARFDRITRMAVEILRVPRVALELVDRNRVWLKSAEGQPESDHERRGSFADLVIRQSDPLIVEDAQADSRLPSGPAAGSCRARFLAGHPLRVRGEAVGSLSLSAPEPRRFGPVEIRILLDLSAILERELLVRRWSAGQEDTLAAHSREERRALVHPETRTWNRAGILEVLRHETDRGFERRKPVALMLARTPSSLPMGAPLCAWAARIRGALRPSDALGLWNGATFLAVLPGWDAGMAERAAHQILGAVRPRGGLRATGLRVGVAASEGGEPVPPDRLLASAESALLEACAPEIAGQAVRRARGGSLEGPLERIALGGGLRALPCGT